MKCSLVLNLKDKEGNLSGKGFNWSIFGLLDGENESKNAEIFNRIFEDIKNNGTKAATALEKELTNLTTSGKKLGQEIVDTGGGVEKISQGFLTASQSASKLTFASKAATLGMTLLNAAMNMGIMLAVSAAITGLVKLFDHLIVTLKEQQEIVEQTSAEFKTLTSDIEALNGQLETSSARIDELNGKDTLSLIEQEELARLKETNTELAIQLALKEKDAEITAKKLAIETETLFNKSYNSVSLDKNRVPEYKTQLQDNNTLLEDIVIGSNNISATVAAYEHLIDVRDKAIAQGDSGAEEAAKANEQLNTVEGHLLSFSQSLQSTQSTLSDVKNPSQAQLDILEQTSSWLDTINSLIIPEKWKSIKFDEIFNADDLEPTKNALIEAAKASKLDENEINKYSDFSSRLSEVGISAKEAAAQLNEMYASQDTSQTPLLYTSQELSKALTDTEKALSSLSAAYKEQADNGSISSATLATLIAEHENWMELVTIENGIIRLNSDAVIDNAKIKIQAKIDEIQALINAAEVARNNATSQVASLKVIAEAYKIAAKAATTYGAAVGNSNGVVDAENQIKALEVEIANMDTGIGQNKTTVDALKQSLDNLNSNDPFGNMADSISKVNEEAQKLLESQLKAEGDAAIRVIDKKIKSIQDAQKASEKAIDSEIKDTTEEKEAFTEAIDEKIEQAQKEKDSFKETVDANIEAIRKEREEYQKAIDAELEALNERKEALEESIKKGEDAASVVVDLIQEQMNAIDKQKDEVNKFYDEQLDALDKVNKELQDQIALEDALEARDRAKSQKLLVYRKGEGFVAAENEGAVKDAQDNLDQVLADQALQAEKDRLEEERDSKLEALDAEKKLLEEYQKLWGDATSKYEEEMRRKHALEILGQGYEQAILEQRTDILDKFTQFHYDQTVELEENVLTQIDTLTKQKEEELEIFDQRLEGLEEYRDQELKIYDERLEALNLHKENELKIFEDHIKSLQEQKEREAENYAERIEDLNGYKEQIQDQLSMIGQTWEEHEKDMEAVEKWEAALYDNMAGAIEDYADRVEDAMRRANDAKESGGVSSGGSSGAPDKSPTYTPSDDYYDKKHDVDKDRLNKLATGGVVTESGWFITDEDGKKEVKVRPKAGKATLLDKGDMVFPHGAFPADPFSLMMRVAAEHPMIPERIQEATDNMGRVINNTTINRQEEINLQFYGDLSFPNITDPNDSKRLVRALLDMGRESYQLNSDGAML